MRNSIDLTTKSPCQNLKLHCFINIYLLLDVVQEASYIVKYMLENSLKLQTFASIFSLMTASSGKGALF